MNNDKYNWIYFFREKGEDLLRSLSSNFYVKDASTLINNKISSDKNFEITRIINLASQEQWSREKLLNDILCITYASYIAMLEYRNKVWAYDYMTFSRRIGELWEPFCKLSFMYPTKKLLITSPPDFNQIKRDIKNDAINFIRNLPISLEDKNDLIKLYETPWSLMGSGSIKLDLDLHFTQNNYYYNCDFKSGFSSNEKGNTNRLLLVGSIYRSLNQYTRNIIFVRQPEDQNNHYLQKLKFSQYWEVYCADDAYSIMAEFTGFNLKSWLESNVDWINDIDKEFRQHLERNNLISYLTW
ncbi:hypothetical protein [Exercitatus varius]|uniref:hypothetical protein n=1 Tax=Exercitatus varius TaxID=67857 RepID=UPI00294AE2D2|nr:hypothetical protein [Exercitatus varius]MDG2953106.1 hypothetical protein [Exercitatus varius]